MSEETLELTEEELDLVIGGQSIEQFEIWRTRVTNHINSLPNEQSVDSKYNHITGSKGDKNDESR